MLKSAKAQLDHEIKQHGSAHDIGYGLVVIEDEVQIFFNSGHDFTLGDGSAAMRGILTMITSGLLETNEMTLDLTEGEDEKYLGSLVISKQISKQRIGEPQTRLDPKNYHIPNSHVTVSLKGDPPFGAPLPGRSTLLALNAGIAAARSVMRSQGDDAVMPFGWWNVEAGVIGIDIHTQVHIDCLFSTLATGLRGLMDLMSEQGGIGTVAAEFDFIEEDQGVVATGWLKILANAVEKAAGTPMIKSNRTLSVA
ncbi:MAG: hypothetical protein L6R40_007815 [Gallowayella cf. fulva]|nr:MAG: hypothetical protein L6R40_007815 [Xanthomendoza cf. fulva]